MQSFTPIIATLDDSPKTLCLLDTLKGYCENATSSITIAKTAVSVEPWADWWFTLIDGKNEVVLYRHYANNKSSYTFDLIDSLGHRLTLIKGQKLIFCTSGDLEDSLCYVLPQLNGTKTTPL